MSAVTTLMERHLVKLTDKNLELLVELTMCGNNKISYQTHEHQRHHIICI